MTLPRTSRILIADDQPAGREVLLGLLSTEPYALDFATDGADTLTQASANPPDLLLLDVMMPRLDGFEVCRRLRRDPSLRELPVILVTALDDRASRLQGLEAGADDFVSKPFDRLELRARIRTIVRLNRYRALVAARDRVAQSYEQVLSGWMRALDLRDHETEGHTQRVTEMTVALARAVGLDDEACETMRRGALLHDIGKIGVPDAILRKAGSLTEEEWELMRRHPNYSRELLWPVQFLRPALDIPYSHHERWDGSGYPQGLKGDSIPYAARLFAVVDAYDALTSERPYKDAWPKARAIEEIRLGAGSRFDPAIVQTFLAMLGEPVGAP